MDVSSFLGGNFLTHLDLPAPVQTWTIAKVEQQMVGQGANAEEKICVRFSEFPSKPLSLNKVNLRRIVRLYTTDATQWIGKQVLIYRSQTTYASDMVLCVRVNTPGVVPPLNERQLPEPILEKNGLPFVPQQSTTAQVPIQPVAAPQDPAAIPQPSVQPVAPPMPPVAAAPQPGPAVQPTPAAGTEAAPAQSSVAPPQRQASQQPVAAAPQPSPWDQSDNSPPSA